MSDRDIDQLTLKSSLCAFLQENVLESSRPFDEQSSLTDAGVDSFSLMELVLFVERRWGIQIPLAMLTRENTASVEAFARCIIDAASLSQKDAA